MHKRITFKRMEHSSVLEDYANQQLSRVEEFLKNERTPVYIDLVFEPSHVHSHHKIELRIKSPNYDRISNYEGTDFYHTLDRVIDVMYKELHEEAKKRVDDRKVRGRHEEFKKQR
ncbi:HPF/RaiA family ribosome-associated protein [Candidatus Dependentiae bacterium]